MFRYSNGPMEGTSVGAENELDQGTLFGCVGTVYLGVYAFSLGLGDLSTCSAI